MKETIEWRHDEEWIELDPGYLISTHGRVYSMRSKKMLKCHGSYTPAVYLSDQSRPSGLKYVNLARAALAAFVGYRGRAYQPEHLDGDRQNCRIDNLRWVRA